MGQVRNTTVVETLRYILLGLGAVLLFGSFGAAIFNVVRNNGTAPIETLAWSAALTIAVGALTACGLWGLAAVLWLLESVVRQGHKTTGAIEHLQYKMSQVDETLRNLPTSLPYSQASPAAQQAERSQPFSAAAPEIIPLLQQLRDLMLMSESQRALVASRHWFQRKQFLLGAFRRHLQAANWNGAAQALDQLATIAAEDPELPQLTAELQAQQTAQLLGDLEATQNQVRHLMSISAWGQAGQAAAGLAQKYPNSPEAQQLQAEVAREQLALEAEHIARLFQDITESIEHRQWQRAASLAEEMVGRYPNDRRSEKLRRDLPTLQENAGALERKEQEELFKDLLKRQRYEEAIEIARSMIGKYPLSPAAVELNRLLPKVEEMWRAEAARRSEVGGG